MKAPKFKPLNAMQAFLRGRMAKKNGMMRVSPYYEHPQADACWFAGYDGKAFHEVDI